MVSTLTPLEAAVLETLLRPNGDPFDALRQQLAHASVVKREFSGVGFFTHFSVPAGAHIRRDLSDCQFGSIGADIAGLRHGAGFLLFVRDGGVSFLEGFSYDEAWPAEVKEFRVYAHQTI